jgi:hypothetical protein
MENKESLFYDVMALILDARCMKRDGKNIGHYYPIEDIERRVCETLGICPSTKSRVISRTISRRSSTVAHRSR